MASICNACGYCSSELKPGGPISEKGKRITSDTACVKIPEIDLELASCTLGGVVTTIEGLITKISESLERVHGFTFGDSLEETRRIEWKDFQARLKKLLSVEEPWTLVIDDAVANSFVAPATDDIKDDHQLTFEEYGRLWEQNEEFGLNDMDTPPQQKLLMTQKMNESTVFSWWLFTFLVVRKERKASRWCNIFT